MPAPTHQPPADVDPADRALIFAPLQFRNLSVKNRLFRSSISGRIDNYNGTGTLARLNFEERFARGGVSAIISSHVPIDVRGRVLPNYATIDHDDRVPFWRAVGERVHRHDCKFILQLLCWPAARYQRHRESQATSARCDRESRPVRWLALDRRDDCESPRHGA